MKNYVNDLKHDVIYTDFFKTFNYVNHILLKNTSDTLV